MKIWKKYIDHLLKGRWHIHTIYTDGKNNVSEYCKRAVELDVPLVAFTEHVRKDLDFDFNDLLNDIEKAKKEFDLIILSGVEAKVLNEGDLDVEDRILKEVDYSIFAFHSFPKDIDLYKRCLEKIIKNDQINTWAHPGLFLEKYGLRLPESELIEIFKLMRKYDVLLEINRKYNLPPRTWLQLAEQYDVQKVVGNDVHCIEDLEIEKNGNSSSV
jgi:DNA polymerase (family 10)/putative hydrolase